MTLLRESLRSVAEQMLLEEVAALCGPSHYPPPGAAYRRAGSERGTCHAGGRCEAILRPRVRKQGAHSRGHALPLTLALENIANNLNDAPAKMSRRLLPPLLALRPVEGLETGGQAAGIDAGGDRSLHAAGQCCLFQNYQAGARSASSGLPFRCALTF